MNWQKPLFFCPAGDKPVWLWWSLGVAAAACGMCELSLAAPRLYKEPQWQIQSDPLRATTQAHGRPARTHRFFLLSWFAVIFSVESGKKGVRQKNHEGKKKYAAAGGEMQTGSCWRRSMRKNGDAAGPGEGLLPRGNYWKTTLNICTISRVFAACWVLLNRLKWQKNPCARCR